MRWADLKTLNRMTGGGRAARGEAERGAKALPADRLPSACVSLTHYPRILYGWDQHHPVLAYHLHLAGALELHLNVHHVFEWRLWVLGSWPDGL